jgi:hypothetical protein
MRPLKITLYIIGFFQLILGIAFLAAPSAVAGQLGFEPAAPPWANWLLAMMAARFLGYAYGMVWAARHPEGARPWIETMIVIQTIDWLATLAYLHSGDVTLRQVTTASFVPVLFVTALIWFRPRRPNTPQANTPTERERTTSDPVGSSR